VKARTRLVLGSALIAGVLAALVTAARLGVEDPDERARHARSAERRVLDFQAAEVVGLDLSLGTEAVRLRRDPSGWHLLGPPEAPADPAAVAALLDRLGALRRRSALAPGHDPSRYGLDPPRGRLSLALADGRSLALDLGDDTPVGQSFYARSGGEVLAVSGSTAGLVPPAGSLLR
jgi:hypothetical protein